MNMDMKVDFELPVIDFHSSTIIDEIKCACINYGFFYLKNHGVGSISKCFLESEAFFNQPIDIKQKYIANKFNLGYTSYQDETLAPLHIQSCGDTKEGYYIIAENATSNNIWPNEDSIPNWKEIMLQYHHECTALGTKLIQLIAQSLNMKADYFDSIIQSQATRLRLIKYSTCPSNPSQGIYGAGEHSDYGLITLLATNHISGLEIFINNQWMSIPPKSDHYIINLGDCLQILSNGLYRSTLHRVIISSSSSSSLSSSSSSSSSSSTTTHSDDNCKIQETDTNRDKINDGNSDKTNDRYSIALFYGPDPTALITPRSDFFSSTITTTTTTTNSHNSSTHSNILLPSTNSDSSDSSIIYDNQVRYTHLQANNAPISSIHMTYGEYLNYKYAVTHTDYKKAS